MSSDWRAWAPTGPATGPSVTSSPLGRRVDVRSRWFPKTRSWIALGFPLELISPLSVLRIVMIVGATVWPLLCLAPGTPLAARAAGGATGIVCAGLWLVLLRVRAVGRAGSMVLASLVGIAAVANLVAAGPSPLGAEDLIMVAVVLIFAGMFLTTRTCVVFQILLATAAGLTWGRTGGIVVGLGVVSVVMLGLGSVTFTVRLLANSARRHAVVDSETGLANGAGLNRHLEAHGHASFVVAVISLAGLPEVREALGHRVGSELIRRAVEDLGQVVPDRAVIGRVEGDELVVCIPLASPPGVEGASGALVAATDDAVALAEVLLTSVAAGRYLIDGIELTLGAHVGLALAPWDGLDVVEVVRRASLSARRARATGQRRQMWAGNNGAMTPDDLALLAALRLAVANGELRVVYQPQIDAGTGAVVSVEALLRWDSPTFGGVGPARFIPMAERTGLIGRLTEWVFAEVLDAQARWRRAGVVLPVAVNLSAKLLGRPDLAGEVLAMLDERGLPGEALTVEVTETAAAGDLLEAVRLLGPLHDRGVRISIDDFGTGYTSLAMLPLLPLDELKVDQGFVARSGSSPADEAIVRSVRELGHRLGLEVVAEGVEDEDCRNRMVEFGFDRLQGYHLGRPLTEGDLLRRFTGLPAPAGCGREDPAAPSGPIRRDPPRFDGPGALAAWR